VHDVVAEACFHRRAGQAHQFVAVQIGQGDVLVRQHRTQPVDGRAHRLGAVVEAVHRPERLPAQAGMAEPVAPALFAHVLDRRQARDVADIADA
jgi:hypothetical protein